MKVCSKCHKTQTTVAFAKCSAKKDGLHPHCRDCVHKYNMAYYEANTENVKAAAKAFGKIWRSKNKAKGAAKRARWRGIKKNRTPIWLTKLQLDHIELFYEAAQKLTVELGVSMEVDHIYPLQGKVVSGLHVPWNLQILPMPQNRRKSNKVVSL